MAPGFLHPVVLLLTFQTPMLRAMQKTSRKTEGQWSFNKAICLEAVAQCNRFHILFDYDSLIRLVYCGLYVFKCDFECGHIGHIAKQMIISVVLFRVTRFSLEMWVSGKKFTTQMFYKDIIICFEYYKQIWNCTVVIKYVSHCIGKCRSS